MRILAILLAAVLLPACHAMRANVGYGVGAGAQIKLPGLVHTGAAVGVWKHYGVDYGGRETTGRIDDLWDVVVAYPFKLSHAETRRVMEDDGLPEESEHEDDRHECNMLLPLTLLSDHYHAEHYALELDLMLVAVNLRVGFNPWYLFHTPKRPTDPFEESERRRREFLEAVAKP